MGSHDAPEIAGRDALLQVLDQMLDDVVARTRTSDVELPVVAVGAVRS